VRGAPTFLREFRHIQHYRACGVPTLEPVYFAMHKVGKDERAILITEELSGFVSMEDRVQRWLKEGAPARPVRLRMLEAVAALLRDMHAHGIQHNCFFPKHVFVRVDAPTAASRRASSTWRNRAGARRRSSAPSATCTRSTTIRRCGAAATACGSSSPICRSIA
jgi:hypothetical protein